MNEKDFDIVKLYLPVSLPVLIVRKRKRNFFGKLLGGEKLNV